MKDHAQEALDWLTTAKMWADETSEYAPLATAAAAIAQVHATLALLETQRPVPVRAVA